jgi:hypothetical protein
MSLKLAVEDGIVDFQNWDWTAETSEDQIKGPNNYGYSPVSTKQLVILFLVIKFSGPRVCGSSEN